jgi:hypothetical protein
LQVASDVTSPLGPVVILAAPLTGAAYRESQKVAARDVLPGTLAELRNAERGAAIHHEAWALAIACLAAAPLLGAAFAGLLF